MRAYCSWFNFRGADQQKKLSILSGGERNRLQLAKVGNSAPMYCACARGLLNAKLQPVSATETLGIS
jgi:ABC-type hemin transport system ATPase subunit